MLNVRGNLGPWIALWCCLLVFCPIVTPVLINNCRDFACPGQLSLSATLCKSECTPLECCGSDVLMVAVGDTIPGSNNTNMYWSGNGQDWAVIPNSPFSTRCSGVSFRPSGWVASGGGSGHQIAFSSDGYRWTAVGHDLFTSQAYGVANNGLVWVVCGFSRNSLAWSADGITWHGIGLIFSKTCWSISYGLGLFVSVGSFEDTPAAWSRDGKVWIVMSMPSRRSIRYVGFFPKSNEFIAVDVENQAMMSVNAIAWSNLTTFLTLSPTTSTLMTMVLPSVDLSCMKVKPTDLIESVRYPWGFDPWGFDTACSNMDISTLRRAGGVWSALPDCSLYLSSCHVDSGRNCCSVDSEGNMVRLHVSHNADVFECVAIPPVVSSLLSLKQLSARGFPCIQSWPHLANLTSLEYLHLGDNSLVGTIPAWMGTLSNLTSLTLWNNQLTGHLPDLSRLSRLQSLRVDRNRLSGTFPPWFGQLVSDGSLEIVYIFGEQQLLSGVIPASFAQLTTLRMEIGNAGACFANQLSLDAIASVCQKFCGEHDICSASHPITNRSVPMRFTSPYFNATWSVDAMSVSFTLRRAAPSGYICIGFTPGVDTMPHMNMDTVCGFQNELNQPFVVDGYSDADTERIVVSAPLSDRANNVVTDEMFFSVGYNQLSLLRFKRPLFTGDSRDTDLRRSATCHWAIGESYDNTKHTHSGSFDCSFGQLQSHPDVISTVAAVDCNLDDACGQIAGGCTVDSDGMSRCVSPTPLFTHASHVLPVVSGFCLFILLAYVVARMFFVSKKRDMPPIRKELVPLLMVLLTVFDFTTDCLFVDFVRHRAADDDSLYVFMYAGIATIVIPVLVNAFLLVRELRTDDMVPFWSFFFEQQTTTSIVFILACTNCAILNIISCKLLGLKSFSAPIPIFTQSRLSARGIVSNLLEDLPQLVIQIRVAMLQESFGNPVVLASLAASGVTLVFGIVKRTLVAEMNKVVQKQRSSISAIAGKGQEHSCSVMPSVSMANVSSRTNEVSVSSSSISP